MAGDDIGLQSSCLSIALKHTKAGPQRSGTPFLVLFTITNNKMVGNN